MPSATGPTRCRSTPSASLFLAVSSSRDGGRSEEETWLLLGELNLVCRLSNRRAVLFLSVDVQLLSGASMLVVFSERTAELAPYRVDNLSALPLLISQSPCAALQQPRVVQEVLPASRAPFAWEQAVAVSRRVSACLGVALGLISANLG